MCDKGKQFSNTRVNLEQTFYIVFMVAHHHFFSLFLGGVFYGASLTFFNLA
jgi:hypothetical protein